MSLRYLATRLLRIILTVWAAATLVFVMLRLSGDPVSALVPTDLPQAIIDEYRSRFGLDKPMLVQYGLYLKAALTGDFGFSFRTNGPALDLVVERVGATLVLTSSALVIAIGIGVPAGIVAALVVALSTVVRVVGDLDAASSAKLLARGTRVATGTARAAAGRGRRRAKRR